MHKNYPQGKNLLGGVFLKLPKQSGICIAGLCAGIVNGLLGAGGGMVLVPLLTKNTDLEDNQVFPASVSIILPISLVSLFFAWQASPPNWMTALPYLLGSSAGGIAAGLFGKRIPVKWLHRILGILILWGGVRYLC